MMIRLRMVLVLCLLVCCIGAAGNAYAQGGSTKTGLSGTVTDTGGGVIPGATVTVKSNDTGVSFNTVTNSSGAFSIPALDAGSYTVTVSLSGFKQSVIKDQRLVSANPASIKVILEVGSFSDTVNVQGGSELVQTQSGSVSSTLFTEQLKTIPLPTRNALYAVNLLPGVDTTGTVRDSTIAGLPEQTINITLDGVNVNNNQDKAGDGFYAMVRPQLDAIEQVTLTTATQGADSAGQGAVQIRFVTRSGTNKYSGTAYDYFRHPNLNTNSWINNKNGLPRNHIVLHQIGASEGGPLLIPGLIEDRGKAFFFFNYEEFYQPTEATRNRTVLNPDAQNGVFTYNVTTNGVTTARQIDLLSVAAANGQTASFDPTMKALLAQIRTAALTTGNITTAGATNTQTYIFNSPGKGEEHLPTTRVDFNLSPTQRLTGTYYWQEVNRFPDIQNNGDAAFPGLPSTVNYLSHRTTGSVTLRSTLSSSIVNELVGGWQYSPGYFASGLEKSQYDNQGGFGLVFPLGTNPTTPYGGGGANVGGEFPRNTPNWNIDDNLSWQRGKHSLTFGASYTEIGYTDTLVQAVPTINFGVQTSLDPADAMFNTTNFPGASNANLTDARSLYAMLTGRVTAINGNARLNDDGKYVYIGDTSIKMQMTEIGSYMQDSWKLTPTLTLNAGLRWEVQLPIQALNNTYSTATMNDICGPSGTGNGPGGRECNLFNPGVFNAPGLVPQYQPYKANTSGFSTDWNNIAPNVSVAWRPNVQGGFGRTILGDPDQATVRAGYSIAYNRNGMAEFDNIFGGNPGRTTNANRNNGVGNLVLPGESWPLLFRDTARLGPPQPCTAPGQSGCMPDSVSYPLLATTSNSINIFDPNIQLMRTQSYSAGIQRALSKDMAFEIRYVGNKNEGGWTTENWNEVNIYENKFLDEFKLAQANLQSNISAGRGNTFAYMGAGTGTSPLPIYLANLSAVPTSQAGNAALYTSTSFTNTTFVGRLGVLQPSVTGAAGDLFGSATFKANMLAAGLPSNFWVVNPLISGANVRVSSTFTKYHSIQTELRRRLAQGLILNANYTWARQYSSQLDSIHFDRYTVRANNVPHSFKLNTFYELPYGRGKRYGSNLNSWADGFLGGWQMSATGRMQIRTLSVSNARLVGMSNADLQNEYKFRISADNIVTMLPDDIIQNTIKAYSTSATSLTGYGSLGAPEGRYIAPAGQPGCVRVRPGDCGEPINIFLNAPLFTRFDLTFKKQISMGGRKNLIIQYDINNVFNNINFTPVFNPGNGTTIFQTNTIYQDISQSYDPGGRLGQIVIRMNW